MVNSSHNVRKSLETEKESQRFCLKFSFGVVYCKLYNPVDFCFLKSDRFLPLFQKTIFNKNYNTTHVMELIVWTRRLHFWHFCGIFCLIAATLGSISRKRGKGIIIHRKSLSKFPSDRQIVVLTTFWAFFAKSPEIVYKNRFSRKKFFLEIFIWRLRNQSWYSCQGF